MTAEVDGQPARGSPLLQRLPHRLPYGGGCAQAVKQQNRAPAAATAFVPDHVSAPRLEVSHDAPVSACVSPSTMRTLTRVTPVSDPRVPRASHSSTESS